MLKKNLSHSGLKTIYRLLPCCVLLVLLFTLSFSSLVNAKESNGNDYFGEYGFTYTKFANEKIFNTTTSATYDVKCNTIFLNGVSVSLYRLTSAVRNQLYLAYQNVTDTNVTSIKHVQVAPANVVYVQAYIYKLNSTHFLIQAKFQSAITSVHYLEFRIGKIHASNRSIKLGAWFVLATSTMNYKYDWWDKSVCKVDNDDFYCIYERENSVSGVKTMYIAYLRGTVLTTSLKYSDSMYDINILDCKIAYMKDYYSAFIYTQQGSVYESYFVRIYWSAYDTFDSDGVISNDFGDSYTFDICRCTNNTIMAYRQLWSDENYLYVIEGDFNNELITYTNTSYGINVQEAYRIDNVFNNVCLFVHRNIYPSEFNGIYLQCFVFNGKTVDIFDNLNLSIWSKSMPLIPKVYCINNTHAIITYCNRTIKTLPATYYYNYTDRIVKLKQNDVVDYMTSGTLQFDTTQFYLLIMIVLWICFTIYAETKEDMICMMFAGVCALPLGLHMMWMNLALGNYLNFTFGLSVLLCGCYQEFRMLDMAFSSWRKRSKK